MSTSLKLLPKACSSRWLATLRSAFTAGGDSIDIDSYLDVIMALWYAKSCLAMLIVRCLTHNHYFCRFELHHDRVAMVMQSMNLANRSSQALNVEGNAFLRGCPSVSVESNMFPS